MVQSFQVLSLALARTPVPKPNPRPNPSPNPNPNQGATMGHPLYADGTPLKVKIAFEP